MSKNYLNKIRQAGKKEMSVQSQSLQGKRLLSHKYMRKETVVFHREFDEEALIDKNVSDSSYLDDTNKQILKTTLSFQYKKGFF